MKTYIPLILLCALITAVTGCTRQISGPPLHTVLDPALCCYLYNHAINRQQNALSLSFTPAFMEFDRGIHLIQDPSKLRKTMQEFLDQKSKDETAYAMALHGLSCRTKSSVVYGKKGRALEYLTCGTGNALSPLFIRRWEMNVFFKEGLVSDVLVHEAER